MAWENPKTDWTTNPKNPRSEDFNRIERNIEFLKQDIETKKGAIVNALDTVGLPVTINDTYEDIATEIVNSNQGTAIITPGAINKPIQKGFHSGQGYVLGDPDLIAANILKGKNIFGVIGTHEFTLSAGSITIGEHLGDSSISGSTEWKMVEELRVNYPGTVRVTFSMSSGTTTYLIYGRIYVNNIGRGITRSTTGSTKVTFTEDITVRAGDLVQIYGRRAEYASYSAKIIDFSIKAAQKPITE